jgi:hypothetical protein
MTPRPTITAARLVQLHVGALADYHELVSRLRAGKRLPLGSIGKILAAVGRKWGDLALDVLTCDRGQAWPGEPCPMCKVGRLRVYRSERAGTWCKRYLSCAECGAKPAHHVLVVPAASVRRRVPRGRRPSVAPSKLNGDTGGKSGRRGKTNVRGKGGRKR